ncbi:hypothetical protein JZ785_27065 [Alicyclobacillus curvatus]|nr:hypothetical protein JZ785_27065 [Alicyclobacillus curvatus]
MKTKAQDLGSVLTVLPCQNVVSETFVIMILANDSYFSMWGRDYIMMSDGDISQEIFDEIIEKWRKDKRKVTKRDLRKLVEYVQRSYYGYDPVINTFSKEQLTFNIDILCRSYLVLLRDGWNADPHYILSNVIGASRGLTSPERRETFMREKLHFGNLVDYWSGNGHAKFYFAAIGDKAVLLVSHEYGTSVMNGTEEVLESVQTSYLAEQGFRIGRDDIDIYVRDVGRYYYRVSIGCELQNPEWHDLNADEIRWFDKHWDYFDEGFVDSVDGEPVFFGKKSSYSAYKAVKRLLARTTKQLFLVDPYIDGNTVQMLEMVNPEVDIRLLYGKFQGDGSVMAAALQKERGKFQYQQDKGLHDRYMFCDDHGYLLGSSLNKFGDKPTTMVKLGNKHIVKGIRQYFEGLWLEAGN